jgi:uncharacterized protein YyaL (SSP411 family)
MRPPAIRRRERAVTRPDPPEGGRAANRLAGTRSPYLLQHRFNPVDWYPWGEEAFAKARREEKPIFLSIGYSSCHWCHVMERESFESGTIAKLLNESFVSIKVDREERPDVDDIYMSAVQLLTGSGGWPLSVFLTPDRKPFWGGTYFPPEDRQGRPGFATVLAELTAAWRERRAEVANMADRLSAAVRQVTQGKRFPATGPPDPASIDAALAGLVAAYDRNHGGFGSAPKFPPHGGLRLLLHALRHAESAEPETRDALTEAARGTLDAMALGGIRDHVGGGFHRYSTDAMWLLPHFEKMLYDNAQLLGIYADAASLWGDPEHRRVAEEIADWVLREMTDSEGAFYSALDADSEGEEGKYYLWSVEEVREALGEAEGALFARVYRFGPRGNFRDPVTGEEPGNIPYLACRVEETAAGEGTDAAAFAARLGRARAKLLERRATRTAPGLDDKIVLSWNGLMVGGLARAGRLLGRRDLVDAAGRAARFLLGVMRRDGRLLRSYREGAGDLPACLEDYAFLATGLLDLHEADGDADWLTEAASIADSMGKRFWDPEDGGFYYVEADRGDLIARTKDVFDESIPSGNGTAAQLLARLAAATGEERYARRLAGLLESFSGVLAQAPRAAESLVLAYAMALDAGVISAPSPAAAPTAPVSPAPPPAGPAGPLARARLGPVLGIVTAPRASIAPGETVEVTLTLEVEPGWHIQSVKPSRADLLATSVEVGVADGLKPGAMRFPEGSVAPLGGERLSVYAGRVAITFPLAADADAPAGRRPVVLRVRHQACDERRCLAPDVLELPFAVDISA